MKGTIRVLLVLAALALLLGACAPAAPAPTPTTAPAATKAPAAAATTAPAPVATPVPKKLGKLRYGSIQPSFSSAFTDMDVEKGFLKEEGFEEVEVVHANTPDLNKALLAGQLDIALIGPSLAFPAVEQGADVIMIGTHLYSRDMMYVKKDINSVKDLEGRVVANSSPGTLTDQAIRAILAKYGVDANKVQMIQVGSDGPRMAALLAGKADATVGGIENLIAVEKTPDFKSILSIRQELPDMLAAAIVVPGKLIKEKPEVVQAFINAKIRGIRYALDHKDETVALVMKVLKTEDKAGMARSFDDHYKLRLFEPDLNFTDKAIQEAQASNIKAGSQKAVLPLDKIINRKFVEETLKKLGKYQWR